MLAEDERKRMEQQRLEAEEREKIIMKRREVT